MSSELLGGAVDVLKGNLSGAWDIKHGYADAYTDLGIAKKFGGAAAAYSLRDIGAMNGRVVKVRRDADNEERDFSAQSLKSAADWCNGLQEFTLPCDVATAAAAYSLRKVKADYAGDAVRVRRASDDVEVDVAFDSNDEVSTSSAITNVTESPDQGDTTVTTLGDFLDEEQVGFNVQPTWAVSSGDGVISSQSSTATTSTVSFSTTSGTSFIRDNSKPNHIKASDGDQVIANITTTGLSGSPRIRLRTAGTNTDVANIALQDGTNDHTFNLSGDAGYFVYTNLEATSGATITINSVKVISKSLFVTTWYDQSGNSKDATQDTAASQPKIAEAGSLLADGIDFDGGGKSLNHVDSGSTTAASIFSVITRGTDTSAQARPVGYTEVSSSVGTLSFSMDNRLRFDGATAGSPTQTIPATDPFVSTIIKVSNTEAKHFLDGASNIDDSSLVLTDTDLTYSIGKAGTGTSFDGTVKEAIFFNSDQSDNRFKIESNINNHYGLYNDANEFDASETSFRFLQERVGGTSTSSDLTGFTLDVQTASAYAGAKFSTDVASGNSIYISFDCSFDAGSPSPKVGLRNVDSLLSGALHSNEGLIVEGFNSFALTSTSNSASGIVFSEGDDNVIFTISNLKVSRVSRDGFVNTWYDQSGNSNDATASADAEEPKIVNAGSLLADGIDFDGSDDFFSASGVSTTQPYSVFMKIKASATGAVQQVLDSGSSDPAFFQFSNAGVLSINNPTSTVTTLDLTSTPTDVLISGFIDDPKTAFADGASILSPASGTGTNSLSGLTIGKHRTTSSNYYSGNFSELIIYDSDQSSNRSDIESNIANEYGITLS